MKNLLAARVFENIADLMEIEGESPFKIGAYRRAAETFSSLTDDLEQLAARGELRGISGVGEAIEQKTRQILETGTCDLYERLKARFPITILELLELPGIGAKTVRALHESLGIDGIDSLKAAAESGRVRQMPRMGAKAETRILESIERWQGRARGIPIGRALPMAEALAGRLAALSHVRQAVAAGEARRFVELSQCISIAVAAEDVDAALDAFVRESGATQTLSPSPYIREAVTAEATMTCLADRPEFAGSVLVRATGSEAHLARLEQEAARAGLRFEGTRLLRPDGSPLECSDEESFYKALGLPFIPPELRESGAEVDAALDGTLPVLVEQQDIRGDLHAHTTDSDGAGTALQMAEAASAMGYAYIAITDHSQALTVARGLTPERLRAQADVIAEANAQSLPARVLRGIEVDIRQDGALDLPDDVLEELEWVVASVHSHFGLPRDEMTARAVRALESPFVDVMAHPTGRLIGARDAYALDVERLIEAAATHSKALEINSYPDRLDLNAENARRAADSGVKIVISTDSHHPGHLSKISYGLGTARRAGLTKADVLNAMPLDELLEWVRSR